jgi:apolipoprotein N-acyltransferase
MGHYTPRVFDALRKPFLAGIVFGLLHALLFGVAFAPVDLPAFAPLSLIPLGMLALRTSRPGRSAVAAGIASIPLWAFHMNFIYQMSAAGIFPLVLYLAIYPGLFVWLLARVHRAFPRLPLLALFPILWTGLEVLRGEVLWDGFAWFLIAHPLVSWHSVAGWGSIIGVYGVGAFTALIIGWGFEARRWSSETKSAPGHDSRSGLLSLSGVSACLMLLFGSGSLGPPPVTSGEAVYVAAIQPNIPQDNRGNWTIERRIADFRRFAELSRLAAAQSPPPDLIVWPETMFPGNALNPDAVEIEREAGLSYREHGPTTLFYDGLLALQQELGIPMVIGAQAVEGLRITTDPDQRVKIESDKQFNSAFIVEQGQVSAKRYDKMRLTPFGETMPYISRWKWLEQRLLALGARGMSFSLEAGTTPTRPEITLEARGKRPARLLRLAMPICYEVAVQDVCGALVVEGGQRRADLYVSPSNDGWFDTWDPGRTHLLLMARWRCIENRTPMIRSANTGLSAAIDVYGRLVALGPTMSSEGGPPPSSPARSEGVLAATLTLPGTEPCVFSTTGNVVGWTCLLAMLGLAVTALVQGRKGGGSMNDAGQAAGQQPSNPTTPASDSSGTPGVVPSHSPPKVSA